MEAFSIAFARDFCQLEPVKLQSSDLSFSRKSSGHFEDVITAHIISDNNHQFQDDEAYGKLLKRFWRGDLKRRDQERLKIRVVWTRWIETVIYFKGDMCYACAINVERNCILAVSFMKHGTAMYPSVDSNDLPPDHTIVIYADISHTTK